MGGVGWWLSPGGWGVWLCPGGVRLVPGGTGWVRWLGLLVLVVLSWWGLSRVSGVRVVGLAVVGVAGGCVLRLLADGGST